MDTEDKDMRIVDSKFDEIIVHSLYRQYQSKIAYIQFVKPNPDFLFYRLHVDYSCFSLDSAGGRSLGISYIRRTCDMRI